MMNTHHSTPIINKVASGNWSPILIVGLPWLIVNIQSSKKWTHHGLQYTFKSNSYNRIKHLAIKHVNTYLFTKSNKVQWSTKKMKLFLNKWCLNLFTKYIFIYLFIYSFCIILFCIIHQLTCVINWSINGVVWILSQHNSNKKKWNINTWNSNFKLAIISNDRHVIKKFTHFQDLAQTCVHLKSSSFFNSLHIGGICSKIFEIMLVKFNYSQFYLFFYNIRWC
jgi:hypothetical protein